MANQPALPPDTLLSVRELHEAAAKRGPVVRLALAALLVVVAATRAEAASKRT